MDQKTDGSTAYKSNKTLERTHGLFFLPFVAWDSGRRLCLCPADPAFEQFSFPDALRRRLPPYPQIRPLRAQRSPLALHLHSDLQVLHDVSPAHLPLVWSLCSKPVPIFFSRPSGSPTSPGLRIRSSLHLVIVGVVFPSRGTYGFSPCFFLSLLKCHLSYESFLNHGTRTANTSHWNSVGALSPSRLFFFHGRDHSGVWCTHRSSDAAFILCVSCHYTGLCRLSEVIIDAKPLLNCLWLCQ